MTLFFYIHRSINHGLSQNLYETDTDINKNQRKLEVYTKRSQLELFDYL